MIVFSLENALLIIFLSAFLPGIILSFGINRKSEFSFIEKILLGAGLGWIIQGFLPFAEFVFLGIKFSYTLAVLNTILFYLISVGFFIHSKAYQDLFNSFNLVNLFNLFKLEELKNTIKQKGTAFFIIETLVVLLFIINFLIRIQTLSPIYQELDPYYYLYVPQQIILYGYNPLDDKTAWYPEVITNHRTAPLLAYMQATWYVLYSSAQQYNHYILSLIGNIYPPFAASFVGFFLYLGLRAFYRKEYAFIASAIASFIPIFILKLMAGHAEIQPYAFFALSMFVGLFLWAQKKQSFLYTVLAGIGYVAISTGSASEIVIFTVFFIFTFFQAISMFLTKKNLEIFLKLNLVFLFFPVFASILKSLFIGLTVSYAVGSIAIVGFIAALFFLQKSKLDFEMQRYALGGILVLGLLLFIFTPIGSAIDSIARIGLNIGGFKNPLDRTIAEQGVAGDSLEASLGFIGKVFEEENIIYTLIFGVPSFLADFVFAFFSYLLNSLFGANLIYIPKQNSIIMNLFFFFILACFYSLYRMIVKKQETPVWFFIALIFPISLIGLVKAKYTIYLGFVVSAGIAFILEEGEIRFRDKYKEKFIFTLLLLIGLTLLIGQIVQANVVDYLKSSFGLRFQDNPIMFKEKFTELCNSFRAANLSKESYEEVCAAAKDPVAYANKSINNQYSYALCVFSLIENPLEKSNEFNLAYYRCSRVADYWIESMEWLNKNTEKNARITSWWDYGHWENFFAQRNAVLRNEHSSLNMIVEIAHDYISGTPQELKEDMKKYDSEYVLFDSELLFSGNAFGGKYGALNYLACARNNKTNVSVSPGTSECEAEYLWTQVYIPTSPTPEETCMISYEQKGVNAYSPKLVIVGGEKRFDLEARYCVGLTTLANGEKTSALYELNNRSEQGTLKLHKAFLKFEYNVQRDKWRVYSLIYTREPLWMENGILSDGWNDRTSKFYDSNLYNAFVLETLPGFELVYKTKNQAVKIFKIQKTN